VWGLDCVLLAGLVSGRNCFVLFGVLVSVVKMSREVLYASKGEHRVSTAHVMIMLLDVNPSYNNNKYQVHSTNPHDCDAYLLEAQC
jgi:hypothetical protein